MGNYPPSPWRLLRSPYAWMVCSLDHLGTQISIGSTTLPLAAILGIAIGGALVPFTILVTIAVALVRKHHRLEKRRISEAKEQDSEEMDLKAAVRATQPPEICLSRRMSFNSILHSDKGISAHNWALQDPLMAKAKLVLAYKGFFRILVSRDLGFLN